MLLCRYYTAVCRNKQRKDPYSTAKLNSTCEKWHNSGITCIVYRGTWSLQELSISILAPSSQSQHPRLLPDHPLIYLLPAGKEAFISECKFSIIFHLCLTRGQRFQKCSLWICKILNAIHTKKTCNSRMCVCVCALVRLWFCL